MQELLLMSMKLHTMLIGFMLIVGVINLYFIFRSQEFSKKVKLLNPIYYMFFAAVVFTGVIILGVNHLYLSHASITMIVVSLVILAMSIKLYKVYKKRPQEEYRAFAKKKYSIDMLLVVVTIALVYMV